MAKKPHIIRAIEERMAEVMTDPAIKYDAVVAEHKRMLAIMGNVDGDEIIAFVLLAYFNTKE